MGRRYIWPEDQIREAIAPALVYGETVIQFDNITDATRFRFACYTLHRRKGLGAQLSFTLYTSAEGKIEILVQKTPVFELKRITGKVEVAS